MDAGLEIEFGNKPYSIQSLAGSKVYYLDEEGNKIDLKEVVNIGMPTMGVEDILYVTITMPLLNIKFKE